MKGIPLTEEEIKEIERELEVFDNLPDPPKKKKKKEKKNGFRETERQVFGKRH